jgi:hypothetical protein
MLLFDPSGGLSDGPLPGRVDDKAVKRVGKLPLPLQGDSVKLRNRAFSQLGAALAVCSLAAACTQQGTPEPTPASPPTSSSPAETQLERETRLAFQEAEKAYRANMAEQDRVFGRGGVEKPTRVLRETSDGHYLTFIAEGLRAAKKEGWRTDNPTIIVAVNSESYARNTVTLSSCEDNRKVHLVYDDGRRIRPAGTRMYIQTLTVRSSNGRWKVVNFDSDQVSDFSNQARCSS